VLEIHTVVDAQKLFDVLALIEEGAQQVTHGSGTKQTEEDIPECAALRLDLGDGQYEEVADEEYATFPGVYDWGTIYDLSSSLILAE